MLDKRGNENYIMHKMFVAEERKRFPMQYSTLQIFLSIISAIKYGEIGKSKLSQRNENMLLLVLGSKDCTLVRYLD